MSVSRVALAIPRAAQARAKCVRKNRNGVVLPDYLEHHLDIGRAFTRKQVHCHARIVAAQHQVEAALADAQAAHRQPVEERRIQSYPDEEHGVASHLPRFEATALALDHRLEEQRDNTS